MSNIEKTNRAGFSAGQELSSIADRGNRSAFTVSENVRSEPRRGSVSPRHLLFSPIHYEPGYAYPLVIWLHAPGRDESQLFEIMPLLSLRNYVAAAPRGLTSAEAGRQTSRTISFDGKHRKIAPLYDWPDSALGAEEAENRVFAAIERSKSSCHIAPNRIFLAGSGSGGTMALRLGAKYPERFAGVVSLGGPFPENDLPLLFWSRVRSLPMLLTVGLSSALFPPEKASRQLRLFHTAGMSVSIRQYKTAEEMTPQMFRDVNRWIMEQLTAPVC